ncbi:serine/threonine-protein kinase [Actinomadura rubrisoli]|uniref:non-specific serine/threonine protein kinase n=1 Tax=Actinomadura rubrisoli TaxID=2530368 RepID=A0A4R5BHK3_9ACTN|nr:serine/threonine-protein kinase [Actinomadura rubrisoli]TDD84863.1 serine/threonine protein kinase [Actinomadura rubrisoli]
MTVRAGQTIGGRYVLTRTLGQGGFGRVWLAREKRLERDVAIKVLLNHDGREATADPGRPGDLLKRFAVEARAIAGLSHPGIPVVYGWSAGDPDIGEPPYLAMQYIAGKNLGSVLEEEAGGRLTIAEGVSLGAQLSSILAAVHGARDAVFHRDLKPENIMVAATGRVTLVDFGSAFIVAPHRPRVTTRSRMVPTTSGYTAPEVLRARSGPATPSDLYSLGCVIYRVFGGPVFDYEADAELDAAHIEEEPQPLRERNGDVPDELDRLVMQLLKKEPAQRPESAREVFVRLRPFLPAFAPSGVETVKPYDLTLIFRDPCRPPEQDGDGEHGHRMSPPRSVANPEVDPTASIENLRRVRDLVQEGRKAEAWMLLNEMIAAVEMAQGVAGADVRRIMSRGIELFLEVDDSPRAKELWEGLTARARENGIDPRDRFIKEAREVIRRYRERSSGG